MTNLTDDEVARRLRLATSDKKLWALLSYFLIPLAPIFLVLWLLAIRREKKMIKIIAGQIGVPDDASEKQIRAAVG